MALTASQVRVLIVIVVSAVAINLVLYASAVFSVTSRTEQRIHVDDDDDVGTLMYRITSRPLQWNEIESHKSSPQRVKPLDIRTGRTRLVARRSGGQSFAAGRKGAAITEGREEGSHVVRMIKEEDAAGNSRKPVTLSRAPESPMLLSVHGVKNVKATPSKKEVPTEDFNIDTVLRLFQGCIIKDADISIDCFNDAYLELSKMFKPLGTVFSFVTSEIQEKIDILRAYRRHPVRGPHFRTVRSMVRYEMDHGLTVQTDQPSGSRTYLRLHWALEFISAFVSRIRCADEGSELSEEATEAYDRTLGQHHPWYMQKAVHLATYTLPNRRQLLVKLRMKNTSEEMAKVQALIAQLDAIYRISQTLYVERHLEDLP